MVPLYIRELEQPNSERQKVEMVITRAWKQGERESYCLMATEFSFDKKKILEMEEGDGDTAL